ncbi:zinc finger protein 271 [Thrips palmi]|uniref:Zinc finger protein 271 n=1 Tax=Thrips palmi TaxID=161013 RepID=A0A6P8ZL99_THRPL|nr:zinc finger protein 271 [Thrips palmi]
MDLSIVCPLCSRPGFPDVNSLWLTLIRATTRQLSCPICQEILCGLDKLTIHLVSHSLHDQMVQACLATNQLPAPQHAPPTPCPKNQDLENSNSTASKEPIQATEQQSKSENAVASYVLINFPTLQNVSIESASQGTGIEQSVTDVVGQEKLTSCFPTQDVGLSVMSSCKDPPQTEVAFPPFPQSKSSASNFEMLQNQSPQTEPVKFVTFSLPLPKDVPPESSLKDKICDKLFTTDRTAELDQNTFPQYMVQQRVHNQESNIQTSAVCSTASAELDSKSGVENFVPKPDGYSISCGMCELSFKDNNIAMLHQQLIHNVSPCIDNHHQLAQKNEERSHHSKQWSKRSATGSSSREAANPLHKYPCHVCNKVFRMRGSLMVHLRVAHSPNASGELASRRGSSSSHTQPTDFMGKLSLQDLTIEESKVSNTSREDFCGFGNTNRKMNDHTNLSQIDATEMNRISHEQAPSSLDVSGLVATMCSKLSPTRSPPTAPPETTGMIFPCNLCNKTFSKEALLTQHVKSHDSKQWECDVCYKSFTTKYFLKKHKRLHTGEMPYTCGICNKSFTFQQSYHKHLLYHSDEKPHSCSDCGRAFKELSTLHNHQRIHTGEKPWACETCGKCFRQRVSYLVHRRIHTGAMPYQCTVCLKSFRYKVSQRTHKCVAQASGDAPTQSSDLLHQLLQTPSKELERASTVQPALSSRSFKEPSIFLKEQMQQLNIKQEHQNSNIANIHLPSGEGHIMMVRNEIEKGFNEFFSENPVRHEMTSKVLPPYTPKLNSNSLLEHIELQGNTETLHSPAPAPHTTPPPADFNIDLLQDILSMVMSPTSESAPSPSTQMRHLSLTANHNDDDLEAGLELRQLLYGSCDSESTP